MAKRIPPGRLEQVAKSAFNARAPSTPSGRLWADACPYEQEKFKVLVDKYDGGKRTVIPLATQALIETAIASEGGGQGAQSVRARLK